MRTPEKINAEYASLCARLGEATYRERTASEAKNYLLAQIHKLDQEMTALRKASEPTAPEAHNDAATEPLE